MTCCWKLITFQFHKGTIKPWCSRPSVSSLTSFNSIKVRLNLFSGYKIRSCLSLFQFHKGTIKPPHTHISPATLRCFNSIKVRLNLWLLWSMQLRLCCFNSIKVRLNLHRPCWRYRENGCFNSIKVRLNHNWLDNEPSNKIVSIP